MQKKWAATLAHVSLLIMLYIPVEETNNACTNKVWTVTKLHMYSTWSYVGMKQLTSTESPLSVFLAPPSAILFCSKKA